MNASPPLNPSELPKCEVQNLQGCRIFEGHCQLDCDRKMVSLFPVKPLANDLDAELFLMSGGTRLRLHEVKLVGEIANYPHYEGTIIEKR